MSTAEKDRTMTPFMTLIERVECAKKGSRELDFAINVLRSVGLALRAAGPEQPDHAPVAPSGEEGR